MNKRKLVILRKKIMSYSLYSAVVWVILLAFSIDNIGMRIVSYYFIIFSACWLIKMARRRYYQRKSQKRRKASVI